jgi:hypothetical protein
MNEIGGSSRTRRFVFGRVRFGRVRFGLVRFGLVRFGLGADQEASAAEGVGS